MRLMGRAGMWIARTVALASLVSMILGCAQDFQQRRAETIKTHVRAFYDDLAADRVTAAITENEQIEAVASVIGQEILQRRRQPADNQIDQDWMMLKTAKEAAAENWLALGRYLVLTRRFEEARGTYQRILSTYNEPRYHSYTEQAKTGLRDLDLILAPPAPPKSQ